MKNPRKLLALCLAAKLASLPVAAAAQEFQDKEPAKKQSQSSDRNISYYIYIGFSEDFDEPKPQLPQSKLGVQVGAFKNIQNATFRLMDAKARIDSRFDIIFADGFYKIRLIGLSVEEAANLLDKARAILGQDEADVVVNGVSSRSNDSAVRNYPLGNHRSGSSR